MQKHELPITLSHEARTGLLITRDSSTDSYDLLIVGLKREMPTGASFEFSDIEWAKAVLRFAEAPALRMMVENLAKALEEWEESYE